MDNKMAKATELRRSDGKKMLEYSAGMGQLEWSIVLEQAEENIIDCKKYKKLIKDGVTPKNFIRCHFKRHDNKNYDCFLYMPLNYDKVVFIRS